MRKVFVFPLYVAPFIASLWTTNDKEAKCSHRRMFITDHVRSKLVWLCFEDACSVGSNHMVTYGVCGRVDVDTNIREHRKSDYQWW